MAHNPAYNMAGGNPSNRLDGAQRKAFMAKASLNDILETCGQLSHDDLVWCFKHVMKVILLNVHEGEPSVGALQLLNCATDAGNPDADKSDPVVQLGIEFQMVLNEFACAGKEITLRKVLKMMDPEGRAVQIPGGIYAHFDDEHVHKMHAEMVAADLDALDTEGTNDDA